MIMILWMSITTKKRTMHNKMNSSFFGALAPRRGPKKREFIINLKLNYNLLFFIQIFTNFIFSNIKHLKLFLYLINNLILNIYFYKNEKP